MPPPARKRRSEPGSRGEPLLPMTTAQPGRAPEAHLGAGVAQGAADRELSVYLHVPFCAVRCGYCDFNTYTATELGPGASQEDYPRSAVAEMRLAGQHLAEHGRVRPATSVFFGGGTPTLLPTGAVEIGRASCRERG